MFKNKLNLILLPVIAIIIVSFVSDNFAAKETKVSPTPKVASVSSQTKPAAIRDSVPSSNQPAPATKPTPRQTQTPGQVRGASTQVSQNTTAVSPTPPVSTCTITPVNQIVTLKINTGNNSYCYQVVWSDGMTVYDVLVKASTENNFSFVASYFNSFKSYYISGIHGDNCSCWIYKLNGVEPALGVSLVKVNSNDVISWSKT